MNSKRTIMENSVNNSLSIYTLILLLIVVVGPTHAQLLLEDDRVIVQNETNINSTDLEYSPAFYKDGIVFITTKFESLKYKITDTRIDKNIMSIYRAGRDMQGSLRTPEPFAWELVSQYHEGPLTFDITGEKIFFTRNDTDAKSKGKKKSTRKLKIYSAMNMGHKWVNVELLPFNVDDYNSAHPAISVEGDMMYFSSDREGGYGGMDLYVVLKDENGDWGEPINLGANVNTEQNEVFPFVHADGTLYFSSNGHAGLGKLDIYYTTSDEESWSEPINLGNPFNSDSDDFGIIVDRDNKNGYFSSNRSGGQGGDDIYNFHVITDQIAGINSKKSKKKKDVVINVKDADGNIIEGAEIKYMNLDDIVLSEDVSKNGGLLRLKTEDGQLKFDPSNKGNSSNFNGKGEPYVTLEEGKYLLNITKDGYVPTQYAIVADQTTGELEIILEKAVDCVAFVGSVLDEKYNRPVAGATVTIREMGSGKGITLTSDEKGLFNHCLKCNQSFSVSASKNGSVSEVGVISTKDGNCSQNDKLAITLYLSGSDLNAPLAVGTVIQLPNIYYNFDDATLRPDALVDLDLVVQLLNMFPEVELELASHTDARGETSYNKELSQRRSNNCVQYILSQNISTSRIRAAGYGESRVRNRCADGVACSEQEHQQNRRTEIVVTKVNPTLTTTIPYTQLVKEERASNVAATPSIPATNYTPSDEFNYRTTDGPEYLVIAGTFRNNDNAIDRVSEIRNYGFQKAEVIQMANSNYHAVVVERYYGNRSSAEELVHTLNRDYQLKSYVRTLK